MKLSKSSEKAPKWHLVYFVLAAFDLLTIIASLYLSHSIREIYVESVSRNKVWADQIIQASELSKLAQYTNAPGNDVFDTRDVSAERQKRDIALKDFNAAVADLYQQINKLTVRDQLGFDFESDFSAIQSAMTGMVLEADQIFKYFEQDQSEKAGSRMATMDRKYAILVSQIRGIIDKISQIQETIFKQEIKSAEQVARYEYIIGTVILFIVISVTIYGVKIAEAMRESHNAQVAARKMAEEANEIKTAFLSNMSHEIRTPMNGILLSLSLAQSSKVKQEQDELINTASTSAHALLNIINDILDFSKLEAGKIEIYNRPVNLKNLLNEICLLMKPVAAEKGLEIKVRQEVEIPKIILIDDDRVRQILNNFMSNAIKFTEAGFVELSVSASEKKQHLLLSVQDTGKGLSETEQARVFTRFTQFHNQSAGVKGTGLGLAICKQLAELMGAEIGVESKVDVGSRFWIEIPIVVKDQLLPEDSQKPAEEKANYRILVAEDISLNQMLIEKLLVRLGHDCKVVSNGQEALDILAENPDHFDLILMDNQMPIMNGLEAAKIILSDPETYGSSPIVALTADAMTDQQKGFAAVGMKGFVAKPIQLEVVRDEIERVMREARQ